MVVLLLKEFDVAGTPFRSQKSKGNRKKNKTDKQEPDGKQKSGLIRNLSLFRLQFFRASKLFKFG